MSLYRPIRTYTAPVFDRRPVDPAVWQPLRTEGARVRRNLPGQP